MAYADLLDEEGINSQYLAVLKPRRLSDTTTWSLVSGTIYKQSFDFGNVVAVTDDGTALTEKTTSSLTGSDFYYDFDNSELYVDVGADPSTHDIVSTYELFFGTFDAHFNRDPLDNTTRVVYWEPLIVKSPLIQNSAEDSLFGFVSTFSSQVVFSNATQYLQEHLYSSSFNRAELSLYHYLDELVTANVKLVSKSLCGNVRATDQQVTIVTRDNYELFDTEFRHVGGQNFFGTTAFPNVDPNFDARPIRAVFGRVDGFIPVNIDYEAISPTTGNNRNWVCINPHDNLGSAATTIKAAPASTDTRWYIEDADGFNIGDSVWLDGSTDNWGIVTAVNKTGDHYLDISDLGGAPVIPNTGEDVKRSFVGHIKIVQDGVLYEPQFGRDYTEYTDATNKVAGFTFDASMETNLGMSTLKPTDFVHCRVYGQKNQSTLGGSGFGADSDEYGNLTQAVVITWELLKTYLGLAESELDTAAFTSLQSSVADQIGFAVPRSASQNFPSFRNLLGEILQTGLFKIFIDDDGKFSMVQTGPAGAVDKSIEDDEILAGSFKYRFDYKDIRSDIIVGYDGKEVNALNQQVSDLSYLNVRASSDVATRLHNITKQRTVRSLHLIESEAQTLADRLSYATGDRSGIIEWQTKNRFFDSELSQNIKTSRSRMPGFEFNTNTLRDREAIVLSSSKSLDRIAISLDDQKGIEDNSGSW